MNKLKKILACAIAATCVGLLPALTGCDESESEKEEEECVNTLVLSKFPYNYIYVDGEIHSGTVERCVYIYTYATYGFHLHLDCGETRFTSNVTLLEELPKSGNYWLCPDCFPDGAESEQVVVEETMTK